MIGDSMQHLVRPQRNDDDLIAIELAQEEDEDE